MTDSVRGDNFSVKKRNGEIESFNIDKIHKILELACEGLSGVSVSDIEMHAKLSFYDEISTTEIHRALTKAAADLITENATNYQWVAGRLLNYDIRKDAWNGTTPPKLYNHINKMINAGFYTKELLDFYTEQEWNTLDSYMDHDRDLKMSYIGVFEYLTKYAIRDRSLKETFPLETQQITFMLASSILHHEDVVNSNRNLKSIKEFYDYISNGYVSLPTPIMGGIRTPTKQGSSCVLLKVDDNLDSICAVTGAIVKYISKKAGIGIDASAIRAEGSSVGKEKSIKHTGVTPYFRLFQSAIKSSSQGGLRGGSGTIFVSLYHMEIEDILVLKNNKGTADNRVRHIDYGIQINNYLYNRFIQNKNITLFSPHDVKDLHEAFFSDQKKFAELYEKYEKNPNIRKNVVSARELFTKLMIERKETGRIYIFNIDNANDHSSFKVPITQSNLCLSGDTRIPTDKGLLTLKELYDLNEPFTVSSDNRAFEGKEIKQLLSYDKKFKFPTTFLGTTKCASSKVILTQKNAKVYKVLLDNGTSVTATSDHKLMAENGMQKISDTKIGDNIYLQSGEGIFCANYDLPYYNFIEKNICWQNEFRKNKFYVPHKWTQQLGELLGWMIGDGYLYKNGYKQSTGIFGMGDTGMLEYFKLFIQSMSGKDTLTYHGLPGSNQLSLFSKRFTEWLELLGVTYKKAHEKIVPKSIWVAPREAQIGFLRGLFTSDGTVDISKNCQVVTISVGSTSKTLLEEVQILLLNLGIKSSIYDAMSPKKALLPDSKRNLKYYDCKQSYVLKISKSNSNKFIETIGFLSGRKNDKVTKTMDKFKNRTFIHPYRNDTYQEKFAVKVKSIEYVGTEDVYDIVVDNSHSFIANGIVVHNCLEITLPTKPLKHLYDEEGETALCTLSGINLGMIKSFDDFEPICRSTVRALDNLLSYQDYMIPSAKTSTMKYRPLGIGIINLAYYLAKNGLKYSDHEAHKLVHETMEAIQFYCIKASIELAKEKGACPGLLDTKYGDGLLPIDHYNKNVDEIVKPKYNLNWEWLRKELKKYGIRNATLTACFPAETSAKISNATNGVEPVRSLITTKSNKSNISKQVVPEYNRLKNKYDMLWDMTSNEGIIKCMAIITKFIDQSISTNNNYNPEHYPNNEIPMSVLLKDLLMCNKYGLKTLYYLNVIDQHDKEAEESTVIEEQITEHDESDCDGCKL